MRTRRLAVLTPLLLILVCSPVPGAVAPRQDGDTYSEQWRAALGAGVEPALVTITSFNEGHEGTQIEPAAAGATNGSGYTYDDYGSLPPKGYLALTREWVDQLDTIWPEVDQKSITVATLLAEMTNLDRLTKPANYTTRQFSSYDRSSVSADAPGWFANGDGGNYLRQDGDEYVLAEASGPGAIVRIWVGNPSGTIRIYLDDEVVLTADLFELLNGDIPPFVTPFGATRALGGNLYFPFPCREKMKITGTANDLYYHVGYRTYPKGTQVTTYSLDQVPPNLPTLIAPAPRGEKTTETQLVGPGVIRRLEIELPDNADRLREETVEVIVDGKRTVWSPLGDFFGTAPGRTPYDSLPLGITEQGIGYSNFPMPFSESLEIIVNEPVTMWVSDESRPLRFFAWWRGHNAVNTRPFTDQPVLNVTGQGRFVGLFLGIRNPSLHWWGEGDEKIFVDGEGFPSHFGTGTEDYFGYAYGDPELFQAPYHNQTRADGPMNRGFTANARFDILDDIPFQSAMRFDMELWHWKRATVGFSTVAYWYATPDATHDFAELPLSERKIRPVAETYVVPGAIEGEAMLATTTGGAIHVRSGQDWMELSGDKALVWSDASPGNYLNLDFQADDAGSRRLVLGVVVGENAGHYDVYLNGTQVAQDVDLFIGAEAGGADEGVEEIELDATVLKGTNTLEVVYTGANPEADEPIFALDYIWFAKTGTVGIASNVTIDTTQEMYRFDGFGGAYSFDVESPDAAYTLGNLNVAFGRTMMPLFAWEDQNDNCNPNRVEWANLNTEDDYVRSHFLMAQKLAERGIPQIISVFALPSWMLEGEVDPWSEKPRVAPDMWMEVLESIGSYLVHLRDQYGVEPELFSLNEPDIGSPVYLEPEGYRDAIKLIGAYFQSLGLTTKIVMSVSHIDAGANQDYLDSAIGDSGAMRYIGAVGFHSYEWSPNTPSDYQFWANLADSLNLPLVVDELGVDPTAQPQNSAYSYMLDEIRMLQEILRYARPSNTLYWEFSTRNGFLTNGEPNARFYFNRQLSNLTPLPGKVLLSSSDDPQVLVSAFTDGTDFAVHLLNRGAERLVDVWGIEGVVQLNGVYTNEQQRFQEIAPVEVEDGHARVQLPTESLVTLTYVITRCFDFVDPVGVGLEDVMAVAGHWGQQSGDEDWDPRFDLDSNGRVDILDVMSVVAALGSTCPTESCIPSGDQNSINDALTDVGSAAILCQNAVFELTGPVVFTHDKQAVYTKGFPTGSSRALLRVVDEGVTVAVNLEDRSDAVLSHVIVDGNRPNLGPADGGEALIQAGGAASGQVIEWVKAYEPRFWSILHAFEGPDLSCSGAQIRNNDFGPAGMPDGTWADGISLACRNSVVADNTITDATDGAIVIFGAPGSLIENNIIRAETRVLLGGIHMVAYNPFDGDYTGVRVTGNVINAAGQHIKIGVAIGERVWGCLDPNEPDLPPDPVLRGGSVISNTLMGDNMRYGFAVDGVEDWTMLGNIDLSRHSGVPINECHGQIPSPPAGFQFYSQRATGTFQPEFEEAYLENALWAIDPYASVLSGTAVAGNGVTKEQDKGSQLSDGREPRTYYVNVQDPNASDTNDGLSPNWDSETGSGPFRTIGQVMSVVEPGDVAYVRAGLYEESDLRFNHSGEEGAPIMLSAYPTDNGFEAVAIDGLGGADSVNGITIAGSQSFVTLQGFEVRNMPNVGIATDRSANHRGIVIKDVVVRGNRIGIALTSTDAFELESVEVFDNAEEGIWLKAANNGSVKNSYAHHNAAGFRLISSSNNLLEHNTATENFVTGFFLGSESNDNTLRDNLASGNQAEDGFTVSMGARNVLVDNEAYGNGKRGFQLTDRSTYNLVENNLAHNNGVLGFAIYVDSTDNMLRANTSHSHLFHGFVFLAGASNNLVEDNVSFGNRRCGFYFESAYSNEFRSNDAHENGFDGFTMFLGSADNLFEGNTADRNGGWGFLSDYDSPNGDLLAGNSANENGAGEFGEVDFESVDFAAYTDINNPC